MGTGIVTFPSRRAFLVAVVVVVFSFDKTSILMFQISCIENLNHLSELRVLNLAGNQITSVDNLTGIDALAELNLRRNKIRTVVSRSRPL